ncbi:hypothetical protein QT224_10610, partial [Escherichia coli]|nr:hypothetical protein [Escherichia coli]
MSNTLNHTSSRQIVRHYTHRQKRCKHLMQYFCILYTTEAADEQLCLELGGLSNIKQHQAII